MPGGNNRNGFGPAGRGGDNRHIFWPEREMMPLLLLLPVLVLRFFHVVAYWPTLFPCMSPLHPTIHPGLLQAVIFPEVVAIQAIVVVPALPILRLVGGDGALGAELL